MADEVLVLSDKLGKSMSDECLRGGVKSMVNFVSPAPILKGEDRTNYSDSILVAVREVSKKRVEAASAATRRAENWDAVVKAAVMAAEAVSQASTITAMGEPIPFTLQELAEAGPEDYWKIHQHDQIAKPDSYATNMAEQLEAVCAEEGVTRHIERNLEETEGTSDQGKKVLPPNELSEQVESSNFPVNGMRWGPAGNSEKGLVEPKPGRTSVFDETVGSSPKYQVGSICALENSQSEGNRAAHESARISTENQIEEGSVPEVLSCEEGLGWLVWLPAKVLNLKHGKAYVCCTELARCEGPDQREYVLLDGEGGQAPRIHIPHLVSGLKYEGTRKRQRSAVGDCSWSTGDKVDAHINNGSELATSVTGVELDPAKVDTSELQKLKTMLEKAMQESRSKDAKMLNLESRVRSKDQLCKNQQEEVEELARKMHLKLEVQSQYEKQVWQLNDKLKGREEICNDLQRKVIELESKLKERETSVFLALQRKIKELEIKLKEKAQQQSDSAVLQLMARQPESQHPVPPKPLNCEFRDCVLYRPVPLREKKRRHDSK
ncbi:uncharacterized protein LOC113271793 [Papaver somniferum]|nr:uncharacterized protein LOC113271793 [Papaver somniferum]